MMKLDFNERPEGLPSWASGGLNTNDDLSRYPDKSSLTAELADFYDVNENQVLLTNGGDEAIELMFKWSKLSDKSLVLPLPAFSQYIQGIASWNPLVTTVRAQENWSIDLESVLAQLSQGSVLVITSPNNPTGEALSQETIFQVCKTAQDKGAFVFLDQAYQEFSELSAEPSDLLNQFDNLLILRTFSKAYGLAGIRVGYLLGAATMINNLARLAMPFNVSVPSQTIALQAFSEAAQAEVADYCVQVRSNRQYVENYLASRGVATFSSNFDNDTLTSSQGNFIFVYAKSDSELQQLKLIKAACRLRNIQIKTQLSGMVVSGDTTSCQAIRITIPANSIDTLLDALRYALEPELVCFDMDGVLIDTSESYDKAIMQTVKQLTNVDISLEDILAVRARGGYNNDWVLARQLVIEQSNLDNRNAPTLEEVTQIFQAFYQGSQGNIGLKDLEQSLLNNSFKQSVFLANKSFKTAIVTGRPKAEALDGMAMLAITTDLISDDDVSQSKPSPEGINKLKQYTKAERVWMCGDAPDDMQAGKAAGALCIGVVGELTASNATVRNQRIESLQQAGADIIVSTINELERLVNPL